MNQIVLYIAAALTGIWGVAHLFATKGVVKGFGDITIDNRRIIAMEWIVEGVALISTAAFVAANRHLDCSCNCFVIYRVQSGIFAIQVVSVHLWRFCYTDSLGRMVLNTKKDGAKGYDRQGRHRRAY